MSGNDSVALFRCFPALNEQLPWVTLGRWPTRVHALEGLARRLGSGSLFVKRDDESSPRFGGNKVRTLEGIFGEAVARGAQRIWSTGAFGSNHALATALHAEVAGLRSGALLFPQPPTETATGNLRALLSTDCHVRPLVNPVVLPFFMYAVRRGRGTAGEVNYVMPPGGAKPLGSLAHVSMGLEIAEQVERGVCPAPRRIVLAVGSTCTTAGLLVGLCLASRLGVGFGEGRAPVPPITAVRVTPWPVTSPIRIVGLARRTARFLNALVGEVADIPPRALAKILTVETRFFGGGYGRPTSAGFEARHLFAEAGGPPLDQVYSEKSGAAFVELARRGHPGPLLFIATRSSAPLPVPSQAQLHAAPRALQRWLERSPVAASSQLPGGQS